MISSSSKYAIRALMYLSERGPDDFVSIEKLAAGAKVPHPYLAKIIKALAKKHILATKKGLNGGTKLKDHGKKISLYEVCIALNDPIVRDVCFLSKGECGGRHVCPLHHNWLKTRNKMIKFLKQQLVRL